MKKISRLSVLFLVFIVIFFGMINLNPFMLMGQQTEDIPDNSIKITGYVYYMDYRPVFGKAYLVSVLYPRFVRAEIPYEITAIRINNFVKIINESSSKIIILKNYILHVGSKIKIDIGYKSKSGTSSEIKYVRIANKSVTNLVKRIILPLNSNNITLSMLNDNLKFRWTFLNGFEKSTFTIYKWISDPLAARISGKLRNTIFLKTVFKDECSVPKNIFSPSSKYSVFLSWNYNATEDYMNLTKKMTSDSRIYFQREYQCEFKIK